MQAWPEKPDFIEGNQKVPVIITNQTNTEWKCKPTLRPTTAIPTTNQPTTKPTKKCFYPNIKETKFCSKQNTKNNCDDKSKSQCKWCSSDYHEGCLPKQSWDSGCYNQVPYNGCIKT